MNHAAVNTGQGVGRRASVSEQVIVFGLLVVFQVLQGVPGQGAKNALLRPFLSVVFVAGDLER